jgi:hypothetical protein
MRRSLHALFWLLLACFSGIACDDDNIDPTQVVLGETTLIVLLNPPINSNNQASVPAPGSVRSGVTVSVAGGPSAITDASGVVVLRPVNPGTRTLSFSGGGLSGQLTVTLADRDLREVAVALTSAGASEMASVQYGFGGTVVDVTPSMSAQQVNAELARSNIIVLFRSGTYTGALTFAGSNVTLFGEGPTGGNVTLIGNVTVVGSNNRMRGVQIVGNLSVSGSSFGMSFSRITGSTLITGSNPVLLNNSLCSTVNVSGSGAKLLGNAGIAPINAPTGC